MFMVVLPPDAPLCPAALFNRLWKFGDLVRRCSLGEKPPPSNLQQYRKLWEVFGDCAWWESEELDKKTPARHGPAF
jgi:hypothetical protein